jgi:NAD(P)-dependent dehydrogenase (short-subunit alcohol dehydrogenase family)
MKAERAMPRTVLLTGTSTGLGDGAARLFLEEGWNVVATARDPQMAVRGLEGSQLLRARLDVTDTPSVEAAFDEAEGRFGKVDVVVNNAGIGLGGPFEGIELAQLREHLEVNVIGVAAVCRVAIPRMRSRREGLLINVSSVVGRVGIPLLSPYCCGKFAVEGLSEALQYELKPFGVRVKIIEPGGIRSNFAHPWADVPAYEPFTSAVREMMVKGLQHAALPGVVARMIVTAANDRSDRLRYTASDGGSLLRIRKLLPDRFWRVFIGKVFGMPQRS